MDYKNFCESVLGSKFATESELNEAFGELGELMLNESVTKNATSFKVVPAIQTVGEARKLAKSLSDFETAYTNDGAFAITKHGNAKQFEVVITEKFYKSGNTNIGYFYASVPNGVIEASDDEKLKDAVIKQNIGHISNVSAKAFNPINLLNVPPFKRKLKLNDMVSLEHFLGILAHKHFLSVSFSFDWTKHATETYDYRTTTKDWVNALMICMSRIGNGYGSFIQVVGFTNKNEPILQYRVERGMTIEIVIDEKYNINSNKGYSPDCLSNFVFPNLKADDVFVTETGEFARVLGFMGTMTCVVETLKRMEYVQTDGKSEFKPINNASALPYTVRIKNASGKPTFEIKGVGKFKLLGVPLNKASYIAQSTSR